MRLASPAVALILVVIAWPSIGLDQDASYERVLNDSGSDHVPRFDAAKGAVAPAFSFVDILSLDVGDEDEDHLRFKLRLGGLHAERWPASAAPPVGRVYYELMFERPGRGVQYRWSFEADVYRNESYPFAFTVLQTRSAFCVQENAAACRVRPPGQFHLQAGWGILISLPKTSLMNMSGPTAVAAPGLDLVPGDQLSGFTVRTRFAPTMEEFFRWENLAQDEATSERSYTIRERSHTGKIQVDLRKAQAAVLTDKPYALVAAESNQSIQFRLGNLDPEKRRFSLRYEATLAGTSLPVTGPAFVSLPGLQHRNFTINVETPRPQASFHTGSLRIRAEDVATGAIGRMLAELDLGSKVDYPGSTLYLQRTQAGPPECPNNNADCARGYLSTNAAPETANPDAHIGAPIRGPNSDPVLTLPIAPLLANPVGLRTGEAATLTLKMYARPVALEAVTIRAQFGYMDSGGNRPLWTATTEASIGPEGSVVTLQAPVRANAHQRTPHLPDWVPNVLSLSFELPDAGRATVADVTRQVWIEPVTSRFVLPTAEPPEWLVPREAPSVFVLDTLGERDQFATPGSTRTFAVSITNVGSDEQRLRMRAPGLDWKHEFLPADVYWVPPSETLTVGLRVHVPPDASEGERRRINVTALSDVDAGRGVALELVATSQAGPEDTAEWFEIDSEAVRFQRAPVRDTPGPSGHMATLLLGLLAWRGRGLSRRPSPTSSA